MPVTLVATSHPPLAGAANIEPASAPAPAAANAAIVAALNSPLPRAGEDCGEGTASDRIDDTEAAQRAAAPSMRRRGPISGNGMPVMRNSVSVQPEPSPATMRPPQI